jgi:hypothetical protein
LVSDLPTGEGKIDNIFYSVSGEDAQCLACMSTGVTMSPRMYVPSPYIFSGIIRLLDEVSPYDTSLTGGGGG